MKDAVFIFIKLSFKSLSDEKIIKTGKNTFCLNTAVKTRHQIDKHIFENSIVTITNI